MSAHSCGGNKVTGSCRLGAALVAWSPGRWPELRMPRPQVLETGEKENQLVAAPAFVGSQSGAECLGLTLRLAPPRVLSEQLQNPSPHSASAGGGKGDACISRDVFVGCSVRPQAWGDQRARERTRAHLCTSSQALESRDRNWTHPGKVPKVLGRSQSLRPSEAQSPACCSRSCAPAACKHRCTSAVARRGRRGGVWGHVSGWGSAFPTFSSGLWTTERSCFLSSKSFTSPRLTSLGTLPRERDPERGNLGTSHTQKTVQEARLSLPIAGADPQSGLAPGVRGFRSLSPSTIRPDFRPPALQDGAAHPGGAAARVCRGPGQVRQGRRRRPPPAAALSARPSGDAAPADHRGPIERGASTAGKDTLGFSRGGFRLSFCFLLLPNPIFWNQFGSFHGISGFPFAQSLLTFTFFSRKSLLSTYGDLRAFLESYEETPLDDSAIQATNSCGGRTSPTGGCIVIYWALLTTLHPILDSKRWASASAPTNRHTLTYTHAQPPLEQFLPGEEAAGLAFELIGFWPCLEMSMSSSEGAKIPPRGVENLACPEAELGMEWEVGPPPFPLPNAFWLTGGSWGLERLRLKHVS